MALTKIKADGLTADLIDETKLADNSIDSEHYNDGSIDTAHIADDQITNAKVNASAAIAGTKISPDFGSQNVVSTGTLGSGNLTITSSVPVLSFVDTDDNSDFRFKLNGGTLQLEDTTNSNADRLVIDSSGNVGIGTTSPSSFDSSADDLVINGSGNTGITINSGATTSTSEGNLVFAEGNGSGGSADEFRGAIQYKHGDDRMSFYTDNSERMRIDSAGRLLLGATSYGGGGTDPALYISNAGGRQVKIHSTANGTSSLQITNSGTGQGDDNGMMYATLGTSLDGWICNAEDANIRFGTNNSEKLRIQAAGGISFNGDTASANALNDYEEGTWTPVMKKYNSGNNTWVNATMTSNGTVNVARYVKVGKVCTIYLHWSGWQQSDANYAVIGDLPFAAHSSGGGHGTVNYTDAFTSNQNQGIYVSNNTTLMQFYHSSNAWNGWSSSSNRNIHCGITYQTV